MGNITTVTHFIILGFPNLKKFQVFLFIAVLVVYILTLCGHLIIIILVHIDQHLHTPMYFFLSNFSFLEIWYTTNIIPNMLDVFLATEKPITYAACMTQIYFFMALASTECFILTLMSYDRYLAICNPLRYPTLMNNKVCLQMAVCCWTGAFIVSIPPLVSLCRLHFCGPNEVNHFFCDIPPLLKLSCSSPKEAELTIFIASSFVTVSPLILILVSYTFIIITVLKIPSATGRQKAFSTCGSHLIVVTIYFGTLMFIYSRPTVDLSEDSVNHNKVVSMLYTVLTPMLNPIIYCLRNKEVKDALKKAIWGKRLSLSKSSSIRDGLIH